ncbi:MAG: hypothetical protein JKY09_01380 [Crocinitomicaceae bacterium]|nr:hypothetical protein [Crocinitomicaceae bacterium]
MKKYIIVGLIVLVGTALIVVPMFKERPNDIERAAHNDCSIQSNSTL